MCGDNNERKKNNTTNAAVTCLLMIVTAFCVCCFAEWLRIVKQREKKSCESKRSTHTNSRERDTEGERGRRKRAVMIVEDEANTISIDSDTNVTHDDTG